MNRREEVTFDELTQAIAGARERSERAKNYLSRSPADQDRDDLLAVIDQLLPDARRYQWLRSGDCDDYVLVADQFDDEPWPYLMSGDELDTAIDRAIEGEQT